MIRTKHILPIVATIVAATTFVSCSDYPDQWGFIVNDINESKFIPSNLTPTNYDATIKMVLQIVEEGEGIREYGFNISGDGITENYVPASIEKDGNLVTLSASVSSLLFNKHYSYSAVIKSENATFHTDYKPIILTSIELAPLLSNTHLSMTDATHMRVLQLFNLREGSIKPDVTVEAFGNTYQSTVAGDSAVAVIDLSKVNTDVYDDIIIKAVNPYGENTTYANYTAFKKQHTPQYLGINSLRLDAENGIARVEASCYFNTYSPARPDVKLTFMNTTLDAPLTEHYEYSDGYLLRYTATYNLYDYAVGDYRSIVATFTNVFGSQSVNNAYYGIKISTCTTNSQDGDKGDYYQIDGVKWAKNDMSVDITKGDLTVNQQQRTNYFPFGMYGNTTKTGSTYWTSSVNPFTEYKSTGDFNVQMTGNDVVYANMSLWKLPTRNDFERLYTNSSVVSNVQNDGYVNRCYFIPAKRNKRFVLTGSYVEVDENSSALCFSSSGVQRWYRSYSKTYSTTDYTNQLTYMTSEFHNVYNGNSTVYAVQLFATESKPLELTFNNNLHVRPIRTY